MAYATNPAENARGRDAFTPLLAQGSLVMLEEARPWLVPVGGFLGAGKTTLILAAARILKERNIRCAAILNDQSENLVDTTYVRAHGVAASEVAGACFCCRFSDLINAVEELRSFSPKIIFAEPVGSCTDLSATILQPLKREFRSHYRLAPLTVLIDPKQARHMTQPGRDPELGFLFDHQIDEADIVAFTKCDLYEDFPQVAAPEIRYLSAVTGQGVEAWLDELLSGNFSPGAKLLDIDYERYARAEAALAWLNWSGTIHLGQPLSPAELVGPFLDDLQAALDGAAAKVIHLKAFDETATAYLKAGLTGDGEEPVLEGDLTASPETRHEIKINLRVVSLPRDLEKLFLQELARLPGERRDESMRCFSPAAPKPERRFSYIVT